MRLRFLVTLAIACPALGLSQAWAQTFPAKPVRILVASSAGSNPDTVARVIAPGLTQVFGQQVIIDNRAGAAGNIGAELAARAPADGYTLFMVNNNHAANATLYQKLAYDLVSDFAPVTELASAPYTIVVHPSLPARSVRDLVNLARARSGEVTFSSAGAGSGTFLAGEYFNSLARIKMLHVPYKGGGPALAGVVSGEVSVYFAPITTGLPHVRTGKIRLLAVTSGKRLPDLPEVPAIAETLPGYEFVGWAGLMVPAKTPKDVVDGVHKATVSVLNRPDVTKRLAELGYVVVANRPTEFAARIKGEIEKMAKLIRQIGLQPE